MASLARFAMVDASGGDIYGPIMRWGTEAEQAFPRAADGAMSGG